MTPFKRVPYVNRFARTGLQKPGCPTTRPNVQKRTHPQPPKSCGALVLSIRKILVSAKFVSANLGPEMAAPILWTPGEMRSFCRKTCVHKIPRFRGGGILGLGGGGGSADFIFMGARIFLSLRHKRRERNNCHKLTFVLKHN